MKLAAILITSVCLIAPVHAEGYAEIQPSPSTGEVIAKIRADTCDYFLLIRNHVASSRTTTYGSNDNRVQLKNLDDAVNKFCK